MNTLQTRCKSSLQTSTATSTGIEAMLTLTENGQLSLSLPPLLKDHQGELEGLLGKVFRGKISSPDNLALARQMSINWCLSKCKQTGQSVEQCLDYFS